MANSETSGPSFDLGNLLIHLCGDNQSYREMMDDAEKRAGSLGRTIEGVGKKVLALGATYLSLRSIEDSINRMHQTAVKAEELGMTVRQLSALQYSAQLSNVQVDSLNMHLTMLQRSLVSAASGSGSAKEAFDRLGLSAQSLVNMPLATVIDKISDGLQKMENPAERTRVAMALFGRGGFELVRVLRQGSEAMAEQAEEGERLGAVYDACMAAKASMAEAAMSKMWLAVKGLSNTVAADLAPGIEVLASKLGLVPTAAKDATDAVSGLGSQTQLMLDHLLATATTIGYVFKKGASEIWNDYKWVQDKVAESMTKAAQTTEAQRIYREMNPSDTEAFTRVKHTGFGNPVYENREPQNKQLYNGILNRLKAGYRLEDVSQPNTSPIDTGISAYDKAYNEIIERRKAQQAKLNAALGNESGQGGTGSGLSTMGADDLEKTARQLEEVTQQTYMSLGNYSEAWYTKQVEYLMQERREYELAGVDKEQVEDWYTSQVMRLGKEREQFYAERTAREQDLEERSAKERLRINRQLMNDIRNLEGMRNARYLAEVEDLMMRRREYLQGGTNPEVVERWFSEKVKDANESENMENGGFFEGMSAGASQLQKELLTVGQVGAKVGQQLRDGVVDSLWDGVTGAKSLKDSMHEVGLEIAETMGKEALKNLVTPMMTGAADATGGIVSWASQGIGSMVSSWLGTTASAHGNVFGPQGLVRLAKGGIVTQPTMFKHAGGLGEMGEEGIEGVFPIDVTSDGELGVRAVGGRSDRLLASKMDRLIAVTEAASRRQLRVFDYRDVVTKQRMQGREGEGYVTYHTSRNSYGD